jgi:hypothetical protein
MLQDKLLAKILHLADAKMSPISDRDYGEKLVKQVEIHKTRGLKDKDARLEAVKIMDSYQYVKLNRSEIGQIIRQKLYLSLPEPARTSLYEFVLPAPEASMEAECSGEAPPVPIVLSGNLTDVALTYLALAHSDHEAFKNYPAMLEKCRKVFGDEDLKSVEMLEAYVHHYSEALRGANNAVSMAFAEISIRQDQPPLSSSWQRLLVKDKERVTGRLLKDVADLAAIAPDNLTLDDHLMINSRMMYPRVFERISFLHNVNLKNGVTKAKLENFVKEFYKLELTSKEIAGDEKIPLEQALLMAIDVISSPSIKTVATDQIPDLQLPTYNELTETERMRVAQVIHPDLSIDDLSQIISKLKMPKKDFYMRKLQPGDLKGFYLGKLSNCCQNIDSRASEAVRHGMHEPNSGFYVIQEMYGKISNPETDRIVAQFFVWSAQSKSGKQIVFDSFERLGPEYDKLCAPFMIAVAEMLRKSPYRYEYIGLGAGGIKAPKFNIKTNLARAKLPQIPGYKFRKDGLLYRDSKHQYDVSHLQLTHSIAELEAIGLLKTSNDLKRAICYAEIIGISDIKSEVPLQQTAAAAEIAVDSKAIVSKLGLFSQPDPRAHAESIAPLTGSNPIDLGENLLER